jgi:hypothetical protein
MKLSLLSEKILHVLVLLPCPFLLPMHHLSLLPYLLLQSTFPFVAPRILRGLRTPCLTQSTTCVNNAIQHAELAMLLASPLEYKAPTSTSLRLQSYSSP